jgi:hypothetical protein
VATSTIDGKTPFEAFWDEIEPAVNHTPNIAHLRVLGCKTYVIIQKERRVQSQKLASRAEVGILVGYEGHNIFRVYVPSRAGEKIIRTSHAQFDEGSGFITEPTFDQINDENVQAAHNNAVEEMDELRYPPPSVSMNKDYEGQTLDLIHNQEDAEETPQDQPDAEIEHEEREPPKKTQTRKVWVPIAEHNRVTRSQAKDAASSRNAMYAEEEQEYQDEDFQNAFFTGTEYNSDPQTMEEALARSDADL